MASTDEHHIEYAEGRPRRVARPDGRRDLTVEGDPEEVHRQFEQHYAAVLNTTPEELAAVDEYPMPDPDELESVPAEEFYGDG